MNMYPMDGRCWQDFDPDYAMPIATTVTAAATPADVNVTPGSEPALILSLDEGNVECR